MSKYRKVGLCLLLAAIGLCGFGVYRKVPAMTAQTVLRLDFESEKCPVDGLNNFMLIPAKGYRHASSAIDQAGNIYILARNRDLAAEKQVKHAPHAVVMNVLVASATGDIKGVVPLHRKDGRLVRYLCEFFSVNDSGRCWWTLRRPYESPSDLQEGPSPKAVLTAYDQSGKALQEWTLPQTINEVRALLSVGKDRAYVVIDYVGEGTGQQQVWVYQIGAAQPQKKVPCPEIDTSLGTFVSPDRKLWYLHYSYKVGGTTEIIAWEPGKSPRQFAAPRKESKPFSAILFGHEPGRGVFAFTYLPDEAAVRPYKPKIIYRVDDTGTVHKLFETPDVLASKFGCTVRAREPLKADATFVWLEVEYLKDNKVTEYQIVKVPYDADL